MLLLYVKFWLDIIDRFIHSLLSKSDQGSVFAWWMKNNLVLISFIRVLTSDYPYYKISNITQRDIFICKMLQLSAHKFVNQCLFSLHIREQTTPNTKYMNWHTSHVMTLDWHNMSMSCRLISNHARCRLPNPMYAGAFGAGVIGTPIVWVVAVLPRLSISEDFGNTVICMLILLCLPPTYYSYRKLLTYDPGFLPLPERGKSLLLSIIS